MLKNRMSSCQMKIFKTRDHTNDDLMPMKICNSNKVLYNHIITSTNDPTMSSKMKYSYYIKNRRCVPSTLHIR